MAVVAEIEGVVRPQLRHFGISSSWKAIVPELIEEITGDDFGDPNLAATRFVSLYRGPRSTDFPEVYITTVHPIVFFHVVCDAAKVFVYLNGRKLLKQCSARRFGRINGHSFFHHSAYVPNATALMLEFHGIRRPGVLDLLGIHFNYKKE